MDAFLNTLIEEGALESHGNFTLNRERLQEQYARFQRQNANYFLLRMLQGLVDLEPERIDLLLPRHEITLCAVQPKVQRPLRLSELFGRGDALSQGLLTCFFRATDSVVIRSRDGRLTIDGVEKGRLDPTPGEDEFRIVVRDGPDDRGKSGGWMDQFLRSLFGSTRKIRNYHHAVSNAFSSGALRVKLDGRYINQLSPATGGAECRLLEPEMPPHLGVWNLKKIRALLRKPLRPWSGEGGGCLATIALKTDPGPSVIRFVDRGLDLDVLIRDFDCPPMTAIVSTYGLQTDASGLAVVRNEAFEARVIEMVAAATMISGDDSFIR